MDLTKIANKLDNITPHKFITYCFNLTVCFLCLLISSVLNHRCPYYPHKRHRLLESVARCLTPGVPRRPPVSLPLFANMLVLLDRDGSHAWHLPDRAMAAFTGEDLAKVNERANRKGIDSNPVAKSQVIEIACDINFLGSRGKPNQLYNRANSLTLLNATSNFSAEWTREKAIAAINEVFDWAEANADTNPARLLLLQDRKKEAELSVLKAEGN